MRVCPVCHAQVKVQGIVDFILNHDDEFEPQMPDGETLSYNLDLPNNKCICTNPLCGNPIADADGNQISAELLASCKGDIVQVFCILNNYDYDVVIDILNGVNSSDSDDDEEDDGEERSENAKIYNKYTEWEDGLIYSPWEGVIADLQNVEF